MGVLYILSLFLFSSLDIHLWPPLEKGDAVQAEPLIWPNTNIPLLLMLGQLIPKYPVLYNEY